MFQKSVTPVCVGVGGDAAGRGRVGDSVGCVNIGVGGGVDRRYCWGWFHLPTPLSSVVSTDMYDRTRWVVTYFRI